VTLFEESSPTCHCLNLSEEGSSQCLMRSGLPGEIYLERHWLRKALLRGHDIANGFDECFVEKTKAAGPGEQGQRRPGQPNCLLANLIAIRLSKSYIFTDRGRTALWLQVSFCS
jgi:hypothetical protein